MLPKTQLLSSSYLRLSSKPSAEMVFLTPISGCHRISPSVRRHYINFSRKSEIFHLTTRRARKSRSTWAGFTEVKTADKAILRRFLPAPPRRLSITVNGSSTLYLHAFVGQKFQQLCNTNQLFGMGRVLC